MKPHTHVDITIIEGLGALTSLSIMVRMDELHQQIAHRPYPSPSIITQLVSLKFPEMSQRIIYGCVQHIKGYIDSQYAIDDMLNQKKANN